MAKTNQRKEILVYAHWLGIKEPMLMGTLYSNPLRGKEIFSFEYAREWLNTEYVQVIDPDLNFFKGQQYLNDEESNFGIFLDSSPDRWGRILMRRLEAAIARKQQRSEKTLLESDYLLGVYDEHRVGGLRFKEDIKGPFMNFDEQYSVPPMTSLNELEQISLKIEREDAVDDPEYLNWLNMLIAPGSSLGGARPKASVIDSELNLWIAKFPSLNDVKDIGAREMVVHELAVNVGLNVAEAMIKKYSGRHHTFLSKRFDRKQKERIHFASAMTMLGYTDGADAQAGASYLELVDFLTANGAKVDKDLEELWKRIVFNIAVTNTDDHLRNHAFTLTEKGWILSPAYDINPIETGTGLKLNISENDNSLDFDLALSVIEYFRLEKEKAEKIIKHIKDTVSNWKTIAKKYNISKADQELMSKAFRG
jgi:serine/threonine-protein kinase HipA